MWGDFFVWRGHILRFVPFSYLSFTSLTLSFSDATIKRNIKRFHKSCKSKHNHRPSAHHQDRFTRRYVARDGVQFNTHIVTSWVNVLLLFARLVSVGKQFEQQRRSWWKLMEWLTTNNMDDIWWHSQPIFFFPHLTLMWDNFTAFCGPESTRGGAGGTWSSLRGLFTGTGSVVERFSSDESIPLSLPRSLSR